MENKASPLQWTRDGFGLGTKRSLPGFPRLSMGGADLTSKWSVVLVNSCPLICAGDWDLVIERVELGDEAEYECQVGDMRSVTRLVVNIPPGAPVIMNGGQAVTLVGVVEGVGTELVCSSEGGKPPAEVSRCSVESVQGMYEDLLVD